MREGGRKGGRGGGCGGIRVGREGGGNSSGINSNKVFIFCVSFINGAQEPRTEYTLLSLSLCYGGANSWDKQLK